MGKHTDLTCKVLGQEPVRKGKEEWGTLRGKRIGATEFSEIRTEQIKTTAVIVLSS